MTIPHTVDPQITIHTSGACSLPDLLEAVHRSDVPVEPIPLNRPLPSNINIHPAPSSGITYWRLNCFGKTYYIGGFLPILVAAIISAAANFAAIITIAYIFTQEF